MYAVRSWGIDAYAVRKQSEPGLLGLPFQGLGGQPKFDHLGLERFLLGNHVAVLAYLRKDGRPNQTPIWYRFDGSSILMSTVTDSPKHRALVRDPRVTLMIQDERPPYRAVIVEGEVDLEPIDPAEDPTVGIDVRYFGRLGAAEYRKMTAEAHAQTRLTALILRPTAVKGFDNTKQLAKPALAFVRLRHWLPIPKGWI